MEMMAQLHALSIWHKLNSVNDIQDPQSYGKQLFFSHSQFSPYIRECVTDCARIAVYPYTSPHSIPFHSIPFALNAFYAIVLFQSIVKTFSMYGARSMF